MVGAAVTKSELGLPSLVESRVESRARSLVLALVNIPECTCSVLLKACHVRKY